MKHSVLLIITFLVVKVGYGQGLIGSPEKTTAHQNIRGTKTWIIPPSNFTVTDNYKGFYNPNDKLAMLMLTEMPAPYGKFSESFKIMEKPLPNGMQITDIKKYSMPGQSGAMFITINQLSQGLIFKKYALLFGDSLSSTMIVGIYSKDSVETGEKLKRSIMSVYQDSNQAIDARAGLSFTLNEVNSIFKFDNVIGNGLIFSGKSSPRDKLSFIADKSFMEYNIENKKAFCISRIKKLPFENINIDLKRGLTDVEIDGLKGYELYAEVQKKGSTSQEYIYQLILFDTTTYYAMIATFAQPSESTINSIKQFAKSFKRN